MEPNGGQLNLDEKSRIFNDWCKQEGVLCPKLDYPSIFDGGLVGARANDEIKHREAFLFVPYHLLMTLSAARNHPVIGHIFHENPHIFSKVNEDYEQLILSVFIIYEYQLE
jgi:hypothetical protein